MPALAFDASPEPTADPFFHSFLDSAPLDQSFVRSIAFLRIPVV